MIIHLFLLTIFLTGVGVGILLSVFVPKLFRWFVYPKTYEGIHRKATDEGILRVLTERN